MTTTRTAAAGACLAALLAAEAKREHATRADALRGGHGKLALHPRR